MNRTQGLASGPRELAAVVFIDIVGYTALTHHNEANALVLLEEFRRLVRAALSNHRGREVKSVGDALLLRFSSALDACRFSIRAQRELAVRNAKEPRKEPLRARVGIHVGEIVVAENDIYGDVVNVASRVQHSAVPGGICVTRMVFDQVRNHWDIPIFKLKNISLKNVADPMELYKVEPFGRRLPPAKPAMISAGSLAALGVIGYMLSGGKLPSIHRGEPVEMENRAETAPVAAPSPAIDSALPSERASPPPPALPEKPQVSAGLQNVQARTEEFMHKFGMPAEVRASLEGLASGGNEAQVSAHFALLERVGAEMESEGLTMESMPKRMEAMQRKLQKRQQSGSMPEKIQTLLPKLQAALQAGDLKTADSLRREIEDAL